MDGSIHPTKYRKAERRIIKSTWQTDLFKPNAKVARFRANMQSFLPSVNPLGNAPGETQTLSDASSGLFAKPSVGPEMAVKSAEPGRPSCASDLRRWYG